MKKTLTAITLAIVLMFGTTFANAGIIIAGADAKTEEPCKDDGKDTGLVGIIIAGIIIAKTGIIIAKTGIIIAGARQDPNDTCGIIIA